MSQQTRPRGRISWGLRTATARLVLLAVVAPLFAVTVGAQTQSSGGWIFHLLYQFKNGAEGAYPYATPILDSEGNLYGTTCNDGAFASGTVWKLSPDGKHTALYSFKQTGGGERAELDRALRRPWIEVTSGRSNESRINGLKHHAQEALTGFVTF